MKPARFLAALLAPLIPLFSACATRSGQMLTQAVDDSTGMIDSAAMEGTKMVEKAATMALGGMRGLDARATARQVAELRKRTTPPVHFSKIPNVYFIGFDQSGAVTTDHPVMQLRADIRAKRIKRIAVISYGWMNLSEDSHGTYVRYLDEYVNFARRNGGHRSLEETAIVCVVWDSIARLEAPFRDILPAEATVRLVMRPASLVATVGTLWAKAAQADRIGSRGLHSVLTLAAEEARAAGKSEPDVFLIGHSLGARVVCSAAHASFLRKPLAGVRGMLLIQPALAPNRADLPSEPDFPLVITQSRHDHANSVLFPIASMPFNLSSSRFGTALSAIAPIPPLADAATAAGSVAQGPYLLPLSYALAQTSNARRPLTLVGDTIASLPIVELPARKLAEKLGMQNFGRTKGLFDFGVGFESAARSPVDGVTTLEKYFVSHGPVRFFRHADLGKTREWLKKGVAFVDCTAVIKKSMIPGVDYERPGAAAQITASVVRMVDPIGSHLDYVNDGVFQMVHAMLAR